MFNFFGNGSSNSGGGASAGSGGFDFIEEARKKQQLKAMMEVPKTPTTPKPKTLDLGAASLSSGQPNSLSTPSTQVLPKTQGGAARGLNASNVTAPPDFMAQAMRKRRLKVDPASTLRQGGASSGPQLQSDPNRVAETRRRTGNAPSARRPVTEQPVGMPKSKADQEFDAFMAATFKGIAPEEEAVSLAGGSDAGPMAEVRGGVPERAYDPTRSAADTRVDALVDRLDRELAPPGEWQEPPSSRAGFDAVNPRRTHAARSSEGDEAYHPLVRKIFSGRNAGSGQAGGGEIVSGSQDQVRLLGGGGGDNLSRQRAMIQQVRSLADNQSRFRETFYDAQARSLPPEERGPALFQRDMIGVFRENQPLVDPVDIRPEPVIVVPPPQLEDMRDGPGEDHRFTGEKNPYDVILDPEEISRDFGEGSQNPSGIRRPSHRNGHAVQAPGRKGNTSQSRTSGHPRKPQVTGTIQDFGFDQWENQLPKLDAEKRRRSKEKAEKEEGGAKSSNFHSLDMEQVGQRLRELLPDW